MAKMVTILEFLSFNSDVQNCPSIKGVDVKKVLRSRDYDRSSC